MNDHIFAKVSSAKIRQNSLNNIINVQIRQSLFHQMCFCSEFAKVCTHQSFLLYDAYDLKIVRTKGFVNFVDFCTSAIHKHFIHETKILALEKFRL